MSRLRRLIATGAMVRYYPADVTDLAAMTELVHAVRDELGAIDCILHAAGLAGDGFLFRKDAVTFDRVVAPKIFGAVALDLATRDDPPVMVAFGSTAAVFGAAGQSDYVAANAFLDAFAEVRSRRGHRTITVDWSDWAGAGMAEDHQMDHDLGFFRTLTVGEATADLDRVLASGDIPPRVIVGAVNHARLAAGARELKDLLLRSPLILPIALRHKTSNTIRSQVSSEPPDSSRPQVLLRGREEGVYTDMERRIAQIWAAELGVGELNVEENSFDLGMDSLMALRLAGKIEKETAIEVSLVDLFRHLTIADLARQLDIRSGSRPSRTISIEEGSGT